MNRKEIKELAKSKIKGNMWNIWWPFLVISVLQSLVGRIFGATININIEGIESITDINVPTSYYVKSTLIAIIFGVIIAGYTKYVLNFVRTGKFDTNDILNTIKEKWIQILIVSILTSVIIGVASIFFVIPGVIASLGFAMAILLVIDKDVQGADSLKKSWNLMKGYKWDYFVFILSFFGWILLIPFTLGLIIIWLYPYITVAELVYYNKLQELNYKEEE